MKKIVLSAIAFAAFSTVALADCTVTTDCQTKTYEGSGIAASSSNGVVTVTQNGAVIDTFECEGSSFSLSCTSGTRRERPQRPVRRPKRPVFTFPSFDFSFSSFF